MKRLRTERLEDFGQCPELAEDWGRLAKQCDAPVFSGPAFLNALQHVFGTSEAPACFAARAIDGRLVAILPLHRRPVRYRGVPLREVGFFRNRHALCNDLLIEGSSDRQNVLSALFETLKAERCWDSLYLENLPDTDKDDVLKALESAAFLSPQWEPGRILCRAALPADWQTFAATRSGNFRRQQRKLHRLAERHGELAVQRLVDRDDIIEGLGALFEIERSSWQGLNPNTAMTEADRRFMRVLAETLDDNQLGELWFLHVAGRPVAALRMLADPGKLYVHTMHYDQACREFAPGALLFEHMMRGAIDRGLDEVDFHGDSRFFRRWSTGVRLRGTVRAFPATIRGFGLYAGYRMLKRRRRVRSRKATR